VPSRLKSFAGQLGCIVTAGLALRVILVATWSSGLLPQGDQLFYLRQAQYLSDGFGFVFRNPMLPLGEPAGYGELAPTAAHPPLYTAWLGLVGLGPWSPDNHVPYRLATVLLGAAAVAVIGLTARRLAGDRAGLVAAGLAALYPNLWVNDVLLFSESMYALTIALVLLASAAYAGDRSGRNAAFLGATVALAALARAEAALLVVLLVVPLILWAPPAGADRPPETGASWRDRLGRLGIAGGVALLVVAPWVVRNAATFSRHLPTLSNGAGYVIEISNCDQTYGYAPLTDLEGRPQANAPADGMLGYWAIECDRTPWVPGDETETGTVKLRTGVDYMVEHRDRFPVVLAARIGRIWDVWRPEQSRAVNATLEGRGLVPSTLAMIMYYPLVLAAGAGLVVLRRRRQPLSPYLAVFAMTTLTAAVSFGITRYRVGADVALVVLAGVAVDAARVRIARRRTVGTEPTAPPERVTAGSGAQG
jgi:4-amino-4-deoxy-L-arabinose transferase-like glycosyltransferase